MSSAALSTEERVQLHRAVVELVHATGLDQWAPDDAARRAGLDPGRLDVGCETREALVLQAALEAVGDALDAMGDGGGAKVTGRTPRSRVLRTMGVLTDLMVGEPEWGRGVVRAMVAAPASTVPAARVLDERVHMAVARALAGGEPGDPEWAASGLVLQAWLGAVVLWAAGLRPPEHVEESVVRALRLLKVNQ